MIQIIKIPLPTTCQVCGKKASTNLAIGFSNDDTESPVTVNLCEQCAISLADQIYAQCKPQAQQPSSHPPVSAEDFFRTAVNPIQTDNPFQSGFLNELIKDILMSPPPPGGVTRFGIIIQPKDPPKNGEQTAPDNTGADDPPEESEEKSE